MNYFFETDIPENHGISSKSVIEFIDKCEEMDLQISTFMLICNNKAIAQFWKKPYEKDCVQLLYSLTKSFTGVGVGIAYDKGLLSLEDSVISFFPDKLPNSISENLKNMKIKHLLSMTCGIHDNTYGMLYIQNDWVKAFLEQQFPHEPGTYYRYSTHSSHVLAAIVEKITGMSFHRFLKLNLFEPLGIEKSTWEYCKQGITAGGMGLGLTTESIAKFGQMLLDKGMFNRKRILSEKYVTAMTTEQSDDRQLEKSKHRNGYGYQMKIGYNGSFNHPGGFGTLCYVAPGKNIVIAATSRKKNYEEIMDLINEKFIECSAYENFPKAEDFDELNTRISALSYPMPEHKLIPVGVPHLSSGYKVDDNPHGLLKIIFEENGENSFYLHLLYADRENGTLEFDFFKPVEGYDIFVKDIQYHKQKYISFAKWINTELLQLTIIYLETPYVVTYEILFGVECIKIDFKMNVSLNLKNFTATGFAIR